jgi:nuclear transport factor 2 (NTF2) superfamily protein
MKPTEIIRGYLDAWNGRDADALVAAFTKDGTFSNPHTYPGIGGDELAAFVKGVWTGFPDFHIELSKCR